MTTVAPGQLIPRGLARRLACHYATSATDPLACFYWTGQVLPGAHMIPRSMANLPELDSRGNRDPQAVLAERRALAQHLATFNGRGEVPGWRDWNPDDGHDHVVPWAWRADS